MYRRKRVNAFILTVISVISLFFGVYGTVVAPRWRLAEDRGDLAMAVGEVAALYLLAVLALVFGRLEAAGAKRLQREGHWEPVDVVSEARAGVREYMHAKDKAGLAGVIQAGAKHIQSRKKRDK